MDIKSIFEKDCFFIIGAPKCGTTLLSSHLAEHPEICFSSPKEPHFFSCDYPFGPPEINSLEAYLSCFSCSNEKKILGEGSVFYLYSNEAIQRIEDFSQGRAKYIICLRNPVDASFSLHAQHVAFGWEPEKNYLRAIQRNEDCQLSVEVGEKIAKVLQYKRLYSYFYYIQRLLSVVPRERLLFLILERDMNNLETYDRLHDFLGVSRRAVSLEKRVNQARRYKSDLLYQLITSPLVLKTAKVLRKLAGIRGFGLGNPIRIMTSHERCIAQQIFLDDIKLTSAIIGFDHQIWIS